MPPGRGERERRRVARRGRPCARQGRGRDQGGSGEGVVTSLACETSRGRMRACQSAVHASRGNTDRWRLGTTPARPAGGRVRFFTVTPSAAHWLGGDGELEAADQHPADAARYK